MWTRGFKFRDIWIDPEQIGRSISNARMRIPLKKKKKKKSQTSAYFQTESIAWLPDVERWNDDEKLRSRR